MLLGLNAIGYPIKAKKLFAHRLSSPSPFNFTSPSHGWACDFPNPI